MGPTMFAFAPEGGSRLSWRVASSSRRPCWGSAPCSSPWSSHRAPSPGRHLTSLLAPRGTCSSLRGQPPDRARCHADLARPAIGRPGWGTADCGRARGGPDRPVPHRVRPRAGCQAAALLGAAVITGRRARQRWAATALSGLGLALQAWHGHAAAMGDPVLLLCGIVHLEAAGAWLGGLPPLLLLVGIAPPRVGAAGARWFSPLGKWCVVGVVGSALVQGWSLVGDVPGLVGTAYGWVAGGKLLLLSILLGFAVVKPYHSHPRCCEPRGRTRPSAACSSASPCRPASAYSPSWPPPF